MRAKRRGNDWQYFKMRRAITYYFIRFIIVISCTLISTPLTSSKQQFTADMRVWCIICMLSTVDNPTVRPTYINSNMSRRIRQNTIAYPMPKKTEIPVYCNKPKSKAEFGPWYERHLANGCIILGAIYLAFVASPSF